MTPRIAAPFKLAPDAYKAMGALEAAIKASGLEHSLIELVKMRASQINGCAYCIHMHSTDARKAGAQALRMHLPELIALFCRDQGEGLRDSLYTLTAKRGFLAMTPEIELRVGDEMFRIDKSRATVTRHGATLLDLSREELRQRAEAAGYL